LGASPNENGRPRGYDLVVRDKGNDMTTRPLISRVVFAGIAVALIGGCETMRDNPRTTGTIGGAAVGAGAGALIDRDEPVRGAIIGGAVGGAAGNVGGKVYKDNRDD
jgi:hypothetical protein